MERFRLDVDSISRDIFFRDRDWDEEALIFNSLDTLKYKIGDIVYLKPLEQIVANRIVTSCIVGSNSAGPTIEVEIANDATTEFNTEYWYAPKEITEILLYDDLGGDQYYYAFGTDENKANSGWVEEWMLIDKLSKPMQALKIIQKLRSI